MIRPALSLLALLCLTVPAAAAGQARTFRDWRAVFDDGRGRGWVATAEQRPAGKLGDAAPVGLELLRSGGDGTGWNAVVVTPTPLDRTKPVTVAIDGRAATVPPGGLAVRDAPEAATIQDTAALALLDGAVRNGKTLTLDGTDRDGAPVKATFGLSGLAAAMLWLDERQNRVGKPARFAPIAPPRKGPFYAPKPSKPDAAKAETADGDETGLPGVTVSVALPPVATWPKDLRDVPPAVIERQALLGSCTLPKLDEDGPGTADTARLDPYRTVYLVTCDLGAYNASTHLYLVDDGNFREMEVLSFAEPDGVGGWTATDLLVNPSIDRNGTLATFNKGRGIGDCGTIGTWVWTGDQFSLREYRSEPNCNGVPPEKWPVVFKTRPK